jgi:hypothetical protein
LVKSLFRDSSAPVGFPDEYVDAIEKGIASIVSTVASGRTERLSVQWTKAFLEASAQRWVQQLPVEDLVARWREQGLVHASNRRKRYIPTSGPDMPFPSPLPLHAGTLLRSLEAGDAGTGRSKRRRAVKGGEVSVGGEEGYSQSGFYE